MRMWPRVRMSDVNGATGGMMIAPHEFEDKLHRMVSLMRFIESLTDQAQITSVRDDVAELMTEMKRSYIEAHAQAMSMRTRVYMAKIP